MSMAEIDELHALPSVIAMVSASDVAKDASDIGLIDNNFVSIVDGIPEGRRIFDNIRKVFHRNFISNKSLSFPF